MDVLKEQKILVKSVENHWRQKHLTISTILTKQQYDWAVARVEELLPLVGEETPTSDQHFAIDDPDLASVIREHMYEQDLSQKELAQKLGVSPSRVSE